MDRAEALTRLKTLVGRDLVDLGNRSGVTIWKGERINKGWAGHTIERYLGLPLNSSRSPNFGSWELKVVPVRRLPDGTIKVKETMAITMIDPTEVAAKEFRDSHLFLKLQRRSRDRETPSADHGPSHRISFPTAPRPRVTMGGLTTGC